MRWQIDYGDRAWHRWFAWYPIELSGSQSGHRVWWEWVERATMNVQGWMIHRYRLPDGFMPMTEIPPAADAVDPHGPVPKADA